MNRPLNKNEITNEEDYVNFGSVLIPKLDGLDVTVQIDQQSKQLTSFSLIYANTIAKVEIFAAAKEHSSWADIRFEIAARLEETQVQPKISTGSFGPQITAVMPTFDEQGKVIVQAIRFLGIDGDRWFLRATISGAGAVDFDAAHQVDEIIAKLVIDRGDEPMAPGSRLPITFPSNEAAVVDSANFQIEI